MFPRRTALSTSQCPLWESYLRGLVSYPRLGASCSTSSAGKAKRIWHRLGAEGRESAALKPEEGPMESCVSPGQGPPDRGGVTLSCHLWPEPKFTSGFQRGTEVCKLPSWSVPALQGVSTFGHPSNTGMGSPRGRGALCLLNSAAWATADQRGSRCRTPGEPAHGAEEAACGRCRRAQGSPWVSPCAWDTLLGLQPPFCACEPLPVPATLPMPAPALLTPMPLDTPKT